MHESQSGNPERIVRFTPTSFDFLSDTLLQRRLDNNRKRRLRQGSEMLDRVSFEAKLFAISRSKDSLRRLRRRAH